MLLKKFLETMSAWWCLGDEVFVKQKIKKSLGLGKLKIVTEEVIP